MTQQTTAVRGGDYGVVVGRVTESVVVVYGAFGVGLVLAGLVVLAAVALLALVPVVAVWAAVVAVREVWGQEQQGQEQVAERPAPAVQVQVVAAPSHGRAVLQVAEPVADLDGLHMECSLRDVVVEPMALAVQDMGSSRVPEVVAQPAAEPTVARKPRRGRRAAEVVQQQAACSPVAPAPSYRQLQAQCKALGLKANGTAAVLRERLALAGWAESLAQ